MPRKTKFQVGPLVISPADPLATGDELQELLYDLIRDALDDRGLLAEENVDLVVTPELRQLRVASAELPFTQLDLAVSVARPGATDPVYLRRVEVETRRRRGEEDTPSRLRDDPGKTSLGRAAATCVDSLINAVQTKFGVLTDSGQGVVR
jgi:hypothetical protein